MKKLVKVEAHYDDGSVARLSEKDAELIRTAGIDTLIDKLIVKDEPPSKEKIRKESGIDILEDAEAYYLGELLFSDLLTIMNDPVFVPDPNVGKVKALFVDLTPQANWAHECLYVAYGDNIGLLISKEKWPPSEEIAEKMLRVW